MLVEIITPDAKLFEGEVNSIKLPGTNGGFEILNNHAPIISTLTAGKISIMTAQYFFFLQKELCRSYELETLSIYNAYCSSDFFYKQIG